jgi:hypothetical protein
VNKQPLFCVKIIYQGQIIYAAYVCIKRNNAATIFESKTGALTELYGYRSVLLLVFEGRTAGTRVL